MLSVSTCRFLIGREKPGVDSEVARLISETLEQEKSPQNQVQDDDTTEQEEEDEENQEEQTADLLQRHDEGEQDDQLLVEEQSKNAMEEVKERGRAKEKAKDIAIN